MQTNGNIVSIPGELPLEHAGPHQLPDSIVNMQLDDRFDQIVELDGHLARLQVLLQGEQHVLVGHLRLVEWYDGMREIVEQGAQLIVAYRALILLEVLEDVVS